MKRGLAMVLLLLLVLAAVPASAITTAQMGVTALTGTASVVATQLPNGTTRYTGTCITIGENLLGEAFSVVLSFWWDSDGSRILALANPPGINVATAVYLDYVVEELRGEIRNNGAYGFEYSRVAVFLKGARKVWEKKIVTSATVHPGGSLTCDRYFA